MVLSSDFLRPKRATRVKSVTLDISVPFAVVDELGFFVFGKRLSAFGRYILVENNGTSIILLECDIGFALSELLSALKEVFPKVIKIGLFPIVIKILQG